MSYFYNKIRNQYKLVSEERDCQEKERVIKELKERIEESSAAGKSFVCLKYNSTKLCMFVFDYVKSEGFQADTENRCVFVRWQEDLPNDPIHSALEWLLTISTDQEKG